MSSRCSVGLDRSIPNLVQGLGTLQTHQHIYLMDRLRTLPNFTVFWSPCRNLSLPRHARPEVVLTLSLEMICAWIRSLIRVDVCNIRDYYDVVSRDGDINNLATTSEPQKRSVRAKY